MSEAFGIVDDDLLEFGTQEERKRYELYVTAEHYLEDPDQWVGDQLDEYLWSKQSEIVQSVVDNRRTAVKSCHDSGKSFSASRLAAWWLGNHVPGEAFVVSTAPTFSQVRAILWREINTAHRKGKLIGSVNQTEWHIPGIGLVGFGRKPADTDPAAFQGIHAKHMLVIIDEACGVPKAIFEAADTLVTNAGARILAIGNPDDPTAYFAEICQVGSGWNTIRIDGYETPNLSGEWVPDNVRPLLLSPEWVEEKKQSWGEDSPLYISKVRGEFPEDAADGVIPSRWLAQCRYVEPEDDGPNDLGVDVGASTDGDATVIRHRKGNHPGEQWTLHTDDSEQIVGEIVTRINETGATRVKIDVIGVGFAIAGHLNALRKEGVHNAKIVKVNVAESASDKKRFVNLRSQIWWEVGREAAERHEMALEGVDDDTLGQLVAPKFQLNSRGQIVVEKKAETRKRLGRSPDNADAFLLAFYQDVKVGKGRTFGSQISAARIG